jgi:hypothetical protein
LVKNINAIAVLLDHALNSGDLTTDPFDSAEDFAADFIFHLTYIYPVRVYVNIRARPSVALRVTPVQVETHP